MVSCSQLAPTWCWQTTQPNLHMNGRKSGCYLRQTSTISTTVKMEVFVVQKLHPLRIQHVQFLWLSGCRRKKTRILFIMFKFSWVQISLHVPPAKIRKRRKFPFLQYIRQTSIVWGNMVCDDAIWKLLGSDNIDTFNYQWITWQCMSDWEHTIERSLCRCSLTSMYGSTKQMKKAAFVGGV